MITRFGLEPRPDGGWLLPVSGTGMPTGPIHGEKAPAEHPGSLGGREALICLCPPVPEPASRRDQEG